MDTIMQDRLYKLLPYIYQLRDAEQGEPLRALLQVIAEQVNIVEEDITQIYDNWFIETCEDWAVPYLGDLIGYTQVNEGSEPVDISTPEGQLKNAVVVPRRDVANTIHYRRRKGTLALLEQLANDIAGWPARAVEYYPLLSGSQDLAPPHNCRNRFIDLRETKSLHILNGPFDSSAHTADVRLINSPNTFTLKAPQGRYNIINVGLFVWRLRSYSVTKTPVLPLEQRNCYTFSVLGNNTQLFTRWEADADGTNIAERANVPEPISRHDFTHVTQNNSKHASPLYYGEHKSLAIYAPDWPIKGAPQPIPIEKIIPADLSSWDHYRPQKDTVAVDPVLGRIVFPPRQVPRNHVQVSYHYGASADIGGGEYSRSLTQLEGVESYFVGKDKELKTINQALEKWQADVDQHTHDKKPFRNAIIEITDSSLYEEALKIELPENHHLQIRAANKTRPVILLADRPDQFMVSGKAGSYLRLDGLLVAGRSLQIEGCIAGVIIQHTTLVPGWSLKPDCEPDQLEEPSIEITNAHPCLTIEHSIVGSIHINNDEVDYEPLQIRISDSVLDATGSDCEGPACEAIGAFGSSIAHAYLTITRSTVFGRIDVHAITLAENTIFIGSVKVARRQLGCMRFCYVKPCSRTPKRYHCQPDLAQQKAEENLIAEAKAENPLAEPTPDAIADAKKIACARVRPHFNSQRYGNPDYCQLAESCVVEITQGADDESEMGVFHNLFQPQRLTNLRARLEEYIPARCDVGIILVN
ncbi:MAG: hypothetical protein ABW044_11440 [Cellvibrio sp.]